MLQDKQIKSGYDSALSNRRTVTKDNGRAIFPLK